MEVAVKSALRHLREVALHQEAPGRRRRDERAELGQAGGAVEVRAGARHPAGDGAAQAVRREEAAPNIIIVNNIIQYNISSNIIL